MLPEAFPLVRQAFFISIFRILWSIPLHPHSLTPAVFSRTSRILPGSPSQAHLEGTFWASRTSSASSTACRGPTGGRSIRAPRSRWTKGQACTMAFRVSMCRPWNASTKRGGKSSAGRNSRAEMTESSSLSRLVLLRSRSLGGVGTVILTLCQKESCGKCTATKHPFQGKCEHSIDCLPALQKNLVRAKIYALARVEALQLFLLILWVHWAQSCSFFPTGFSNKHLNH